MQGSGRHAGALVEASLLGLNRDCSADEEPARASVEDRGTGGAVQIVDNVGASADLQQAQTAT